MVLENFEFKKQFGYNWNMGPKKIWLTEILFPQFFDPKKIFGRKHNG